MSRVGIAELAAQQENWDEAAKQINAVLAALPANSPIASELQKLKTQWRTQQRKLTQELPPASQAVNRWQQEGLSPGVLSAIDHACQIMPAAWFDVPLNERRKLTLATIEAGYFDTARLLLKTAFADNLKRKTVDNLRAELDQALQMRAVSETEAARQALASDNAEHAVHLADIALGFKPDYFPARLVRAEARLAAGQDIAALGDFRALMDKAGDAALQHTARLGAARTLEARRDYEEALTLLDGLTDDTAAALRNRLERRQRGEPVVHLEQVNSVVMHDTLTRATTETHYQGYFAVAVRAARRPWNISLAEWNDRLWAAGFEFVQVLGGLRNFVGDPVFAMRIISKPHPLLPERGHLTLAFLVRVSAPDETTCRELALNLWWTINSVLPLAQDYIYDFQAVADETELKSLLVPFDATNIAEVVRREEVPLQDDDRYAIYPFTPGSNDLQNVCWTLLRQKVPAMISVHLLPTDLMAWERAAFDQIMLGEPTVAPDMQPDSGQIGFRDPVSQWWQGNPQWGRAQANRRMVDALRTQAYVLRVSVASGAGSSSLLPEIVAAALFGPSRPVGEALYGGYEVIRASRADEFEIARHNLAALDIEGWVYTAAPENAARLRHLMGESEAAMVFRLPIPMSQAIPGVPVMEVKPIAPPSNLPMHGVMWGESVARVSGSSLRVMQSVDDRRRHAYVVGKTGTGKSTLLKNLALQDIEAGHGVCVIDPHSDLIEDILARIPEHRVEDVILFDPSDEDRPVGLNLMEAHSEAEKHRIVTEFIGMLVRMYDPHQQGIVGPRFQHNVRNAMLTAMCTDESTLVEVVRALTDIEYVKKILPRIDDPLVRNYWEKQIPSTSDFHKSEILDYLVSKFNRFVGDRLIRNIIGQRHTTIDFRQVMDQKKVLLVNLSKGKIGPESAQFLGLLLVQRLLITALSRADVAPDQRPDFFLYVDEFQNFATELFATVLSEGRKYGVAVTVANQYLTQLDHTIREAIFGNVGTILSFRLGTQDAAILAPEMYPVFGADDLLNLPKFTTCSKLLADGVAARPFTMRTVLDTRPPDQARALRIRELSRQKYGRDAAEVSEDVLARFRASLRSS
ncbi:MAG: type IV secretion system DNA-binding domain-containing protein, partial [Chloroflexi bacterium]|nr:type IV secretion system DNA-binding domain-containing protein [Chloroflexota bacterium]